jgi:prevent-host-death family protein
MTSYSITELKAKASEILRALDDGEEVIITRRGTPCGKLTSIQSVQHKKLPIDEVRKHFAHMPDVQYEEFLELKRVWGPQLLPDTLGRDVDG